MQASTRLRPATQSADRFIERFEFGLGEGFVVGEDAQAFDERHG